MCPLNYPNFETKVFTSDMAQISFLLFMYSRFPAVTRHFIVNESGPEIVHEGIYRLQAKLNLLHEKIFPLLPRQIDPPQVNDWTRLNFLFA